MPTTENHLCTVDEEIRETILRPAALAVFESGCAMAPARSLVPKGSEELDAVIQSMEEAAVGLDGIHAFAFPSGRNEGGYYLIYAAGPWVAELCEWVYANAPMKQKQQIMYLLMGYSPQFITAEFGRRD